MARYSVTITILAICTICLVNQVASDCDTKGTAVNKYFNGTVSCANCNQEKNCWCEQDTSPCQNFKKLLSSGVYGTWGPRVTECNDCMKSYPPMGESCYSYQKWTDIQNCALNTASKFEGQPYKCDNMELAMIAGVCLIRNMIGGGYGNLGCMDQSHCTKILDSPRMNVSKPSFSGGTDDYPDCGLSKNWFFDPPPCSDKILHDKLDKCLLQDLDTTKLNDVAKGYLRAWYEEYRGNLCGAEHFISTGFGTVKKPKTVPYLPQRWENIKKKWVPTDPDVIEVKGLNF